MPITNLHQPQIVLREKAQKTQKLFWLTHLCR